MFDATRIQSATGVQRVEVFARLASTNDRAISMVRREGLTGSAVIVAQEQTAGRGQRDRKWWSGKGSLTFSWAAVGIKNRFANEDSKGLLPIAAALAVVDAIESVANLPGIEIKWPNDLLFNNRKLCGILIETVTIDQDLVPIVGVGVNVNNQEIDTTQVETLTIESGSTHEPTSIHAETGRATSLEVLLIAVTQRLQIEFENVGIKPDSIVERCNDRLAFCDRQINVVKPSGTSVRGTCVGVAIDGGLVIRTAISDETIYSGTISASDPA